MTLTKTRIVELANRHGQGECWPWSGPIDKDGYGRAPFGRLAHRVAYELLSGPIPTGLEIDHLCRNRACVNPCHMEAVTHAENLRRSDRHVSHCRHGHEFTLENTYVRPDETRACRACIRERTRRYQQRRKMAG